MISREENRKFWDEISIKNETNRCRMCGCREPITGYSRESTIDKILSKKYFAAGTKPKKTK